MPYVAFEVLSGDNPFTQKADIYGFGIIIVEMSTSQRPFDKHEFNLKLAVEICKELQPKIASELDANNVDSIDAGEIKPFYQMKW
ncbi:hypothetical protein C2G38_2188392 [Gigaspora rosea]|uniref:Protein kinase domain-containing protein n=1 Tax=Gigaspora rosea TaxID=44941 RepID=A0A397VCM6_9GLOM|nr:hypothetical protein C2G38_2188392 [Gigaspora rosea]